MRVIYLKKLPPRKRLNLSKIGSMAYPTPVELHSNGPVRVVYTYAEYTEEALKDSDQPILIGESQEYMGRLTLIHMLMETGEISSSRENWLYGLLNPAELGVYPTTMPAFLNSRLTTAVCETAYRYAMYGALFSRSMGVLARLPLQGEYSDDLNREQMRAFHYNVGIVSEFLEGESGSDYRESAHAILDRGML